MLCYASFSRTAYPDSLLQVRLAGADHAEAALLLQAAFAVVVGYAGGDAQAACLGAGAPLGGLDQAVVAHQGGVRAVRLLLSVSCRDRNTHEGKHNGQLPTSYRPSMKASKQCVFLNHFVSDLK